MATKGPNPRMGTEMALAFAVGAAWFALSEAGDKTSGTGSAAGGRGY